MANHYFLTDLSDQQQQSMKEAGLPLTSYAMGDKVGLLVSAREIDWALQVLGMKIEAMGDSSPEGVFTTCLGPVVEDNPASPRVRVLYWPNVHESSAGVSRFREATEAILLPALRKNILLYGHTIVRNHAPIENGSFHVYLWSAPNRTRPSRDFACESQTIFGLRVASGMRWAWYPTSNEGEIIQNPENGHAVAELIGNNLYILAPLVCNEFPQGAAIYAKILEEVVVLLAMDVAERRTRERARAKATFLRTMNQRLERNITRTEESIAQKTACYTDAKVSLADQFRNDRDAKRILREGFPEQHIREMIGREFDQLVSTPGVKRVLINHDKIEAYTDTIFCQDPRTKKWHEIGKFRMEIRWKAKEDKVYFFNLNYSIAGHQTGMQAPHVFSDGRPCLGSARDIFMELLAGYKFADLIIYAIQYLSSVNVDDRAGTHIDKWPVAEHPPQAVVAATAAA